MVAGMVMPLADLRAIYELLFRDGVMVAKKDKRPQTKHPDVPGVKNLQVIRAMGSLKSRGFVRETFAWRHYYWYLTNEGIVYLREYLHLPPEIVPTPLQRVRRPAATLALAHRAARVQSVQGPTSYVPKPGTRPGAESQEALMERQGYRHKRMGGVAEEMMSAERTPRFRGRPIVVEQEKPKASWDSGDQSQPSMRNGQPFHSEPDHVMEQGNSKKITMETASKRPLMDAVSTKSMFTVQEKIVSGSHRGSTQTAESTTSSNMSSSQAQFVATAAVTAVAVGLGVPSVTKSSKEVPKKEVPAPEPQETAKLTQTDSNKQDQAIVTQVEPSGKVEKKKKTAEPKTTAKEPNTTKPVKSLTKTLSDGVDEIKEVVVNVEHQNMKLKTADVKPKEDSHKVSAEAVVNDTVSAAVKTDVVTSKTETKVNIKKKTEVKITQMIAQQPAENNSTGQQTPVEMAKPEAEVPVQLKAEVKKVSAGQDMQGPKTAPSLEAPIRPAISQQAAVKAEVKVTEDTSTSSAAKQTGPPTMCVEKITVEQKSIKVELKKQEEEAAKSETSPVQLSPPPSKSADIPPEVEAVSEVNPKVSKSKRKKQMTPPAVKPTPTSLPAVVQLEATKVETTTIKDDPPKSSVPAITNDPPKIPSEGMCTEEVCPAAAVQTEAPAHKGEEEPASLGAEKIEREVLRAKTSSSVREAPAAAPASATETGAAHKTSPRYEQGEPPSVAQHTAALAAVSASAAAAAPAEPEKGEREERLSHTRASEQGKDLQSQTPAVITAANPPAAAKPQPEGVRPKADKREEDEAEADSTMRKKIVVVEEVIEVQQIANPAVAGSPPAQAAPMTETDDLDYDVLEQLAMERALLAGGAMIGERTGSPDEWDHSLEEPEEKTWPNFQEGLTMFQFCSPLSISFSSLPPPSSFFPSYTCDVTETVARAISGSARSGGSVKVNRVCCPLWSWHLVCYG